MTGRAGPPAPTCPLTSAPRLGASGAPGAVTGTRSGDEELEPPDTTASTHRRSPGDRWLGPMVRRQRKRAPAAASERAPAAASERAPAADSERAPARPRGHQGRTP